MKHLKVVSKMPGQADSMTIADIIDMVVSILDAVVEFLDDTDKSASE